MSEKLKNPRPQGAMAQTTQTTQTDIEYKWRKRIAAFLSSLISPYLSRYRIKRIKNYDSAIITLAKTLTSLELFIRGLSDDYYLPPPSAYIEIMAPDEFSIYRERPIASFRLIEDNTAEYDEWMLYNRRIIYLPSQLFLRELPYIETHQERCPNYVFCISYNRGYDDVQQKYISWGANGYITFLRVRDSNYKKVEKPFLGLRLWTWKYLDETYVYFPLDAPPKSSPPASPR